MRKNVWLCICEVAKCSKILGFARMRINISLKHEVLHLWVCKMSQTYAVLHECGWNNAWKHQVLHNCIEKCSTAKALTHFWCAVAKNPVRNDMEPKKCKHTQKTNKKQCFTDSWVSWGPQLKQESLKQCFFGGGFVCFSQCFLRSLVPYSFLRGFGRLRSKNA